MRSQKQIETQIVDIKRRISDAQELQTIATFAGADRLLALLNKTKDFYQKSLNSLDENNPALAKEYAKDKICMNLIDGFINGMVGAASKIEELKKVFLDLNEELGKVMDEQKDREKRSM